MKMKNHSSTRQRQRHLLFIVTLFHLYSAATGSSIRGGTSTTTALQQQQQQQQQHQQEQVMGLNYQLGWMHDTDVRVDYSELVPADPTIFEEEEKDEEEDPTDTDADADANTNTTDNIAFFQIDDTTPTPTPTSNAASQYRNTFTLIKEDRIDTTKNPSSVKEDGIYIYVRNNQVEIGMVTQQQNKDDPTQNNRIMNVYIAEDETEMTSNNVYVMNNNNTIQIQLAATATPTATEVDEKADAYVFMEYEEVIPASSDYVKLSEEGYGERDGRSLSELRFNKNSPVVDDYMKFQVLRDYGLRRVHTGVFPLTDSDYPLDDTNPKVILLCTQTTADSVILPGDYQLRHNAQDNDANYWLQYAGGTPYFPGTDGDLFWHELRHVVDVQIARRSNTVPSSVNCWPATWNTTHTTLEECAEAVKGEYPGFHQQTFIETLFAATKKLEFHREIAPFRSVADFVATQVRIASINSWSVEVISAITFLIKWHVGMPRPEELVWMIHLGAYTAEADGVPQDIVEKITSMELTHPEEFTAYEIDGCPQHPSYPAMHSAASTVSYWLPAIVQLTGEQYCEALRVDYATAYARTVAGVHYPQDNIAGLNIGQRIVREKFPAMMVEKYGYQHDKLQARLEALSFDWNTFDAVDCTIAGVPVADFLQQ